MQARRAALRGSALAGNKQLSSEGQAQWLRQTSIGG
jgi:hypothetical protein